MKLRRWRRGRVGMVEESEIPHRNGKYVWVDASEVEAALAERDGRIGKQDAQIQLLNSVIYGNRDTAVIGFIEELSGKQARIDKLDIENKNHRKEAIARQDKIDEMHSENSRLKDRVLALRIEIDPVNGCLAEGSGQMAEQAALNRWFLTHTTEDDKGTITGLAADQAGTDELFEILSRAKGGT